MRHFWNWVKNEDATRTLYLEGVIAEESWFADDVTPAMFKEELYSGDGPITLHINSPGGDCVAASVIYTALMEYPHEVTVFITGLAASAASVVAMAGTKVIMSPTAMMMIHNPWTMAIGDKEEMRKAAHLLDEVKESIVNAYEIKTGLPRAKIETLMDNETWLSAYKAKSLGFCDEVAYSQENGNEQGNNEFMFSGRAAALALENKIMAKAQEEKDEEEEVHGLIYTSGCLSNDTTNFAIGISADKIAASILSADDIASGNITTTAELTAEDIADIEEEAEEADNDRVNAQDLLNRLALIKNY